MAVGTLNIINSFALSGSTFEYDIVAHGGYIFVSYNAGSTYSVDCYTFNGATFNFESTYTINDGFSTRSLERLTAFDDGGIQRIMGSTQVYQYSLTNTTGTLAKEDNDFNNGSEIYVDTDSSIIHWTAVNTLIARNFPSGHWGSFIANAGVAFTSGRTVSAVKVGGATILFVDDQGSNTLRAYEFNGSAYTFKDAITQGISQRNRSIGSDLSNLTVHCAANGVKAFKYNNGALSLLSEDSPAGVNTASQDIWILDSSTIVMVSSGGTNGDKGVYVYNFDGSNYTLTHQNLTDVGQPRAVSSDGTYIYLLDDAGLVYALELGAVPIGSSLNKIIDCF